MKTQLTVMRLANMHKVHAQMTTAYNCDLCGEQAGIYPSGQRVIREHGRNNIVIVCDVCAGPDVALVAPPAPGALEEVGQSVPFDPTKKQ
jgi:hypothetical protein